MNNDTSPATKADIAALESKVDAAVTELKRYFNVMVETMRHDFQDAYHDGYELLRDRVDRLERHVGIAA